MRDKEGKMDVLEGLARYISGPSGIFWGFCGIATTYVGMGIAELVGERKKNWLQVLWFVPGAVFAYLAFSSLTYGVVNDVDAGKVLAYLGIGTGLVCVGWTMRASREKQMSKYVVAWVLIIIGDIFVLAGAVLMVASRVMPLENLVILVAVTVVFYTIYRT